LSTAASLSRRPWIEHEGKLTGAAAAATVPVVPTIASATPVMQGVEEFEALDWWETCELRAFMRAFPPLRAERAT